MKRFVIAAIVGGIAAVAVISIAAYFMSGSGLPTTLPEEESVPAEIYPVSSSPYGKTIPEWQGEVWKWFQEIEMEMNPGNDSTGELCDVNQNNPDVWFLLNTFGGKAIRECTIPEGRALVILIGGLSCSFAEDPTLKTEEDLRKCAEDNAVAMVPRLSIDGVSIENVKEDHYSVSPPTLVNFPEGNIWDVKGPVTSTFVAAGWVVVVEPLTLGEHTLQYVAEERDFTAMNEVVWSTEVEYHLTVVEDVDESTTV